MKLRTVVALIEEMLGMPDHGDEPRADMFLPSWLLAFGILLAVGAIGFAVAFVVTRWVVWIAVAVGCALLSVAAVLCWRNQTIRILDEHTFEYTTFLGNKKVYAFADIKSCRRNADSMTLFVGDGKIHIESIAVMSDALVDRFNGELGDS